MPPSPLEAIAAYRQTALQRTAGIVLACNSTDMSQRAAMYEDVVQLLTASLEMLGVAETHLAQERTAATAAERDVQRRFEYERRLFDCAPTALLVTDVLGTIVEANCLAAELLGRDALQLYGLPIASLVPTDQQREFRTQLSRVTLAESTSDWRFHVTRPRDSRLTLHACIQIVRGASPHSERDRLFWALQPVRTADERRSLDDAHSSRARSTTSQSTFSP